jgi:hypothetical protein
MAMIILEVRLEFQPFRRERNETTARRSALRRSATVVSASRRYYQRSAGSIIVLLPHFMRYTELEPFIRQSEFQRGRRTQRGKEVAKV